MVAVIRRALTPQTALSAVVAVDLPWIVMEEPAETSMNASSIQTTAQRAAFASTIMAASPAVATLGSCPRAGTVWTSTSVQLTPTTVSRPAPILWEASLAAALVASQ